METEPEEDRDEECQIAQKTRFNKRYLTITYNNMKKTTLQKYLIERKRCDGYMIATRGSDVVAVLYRKRKYNFASLTPSHMKVGYKRGRISERISEEEIAAIDRDYLVDGDHFVRNISPATEEPEEPEVQQPQPQPPPQPQVPPPQDSNMFQTLPEPILRALMIKRKREFGLEDDFIKTMQKEHIIMLLSN